MKTRLRHLFIRNLRGMDRFEVFMVAAVSTILGLRLFLEISGYPQMGNGTLHIAHAMWGGLLMGLSVVVSSVFLSEAAGTLAALMGGAGFGLFIDEAGKFVTRSNDYFFRPSVAIIYVSLVALFLVVRYVFTSARIREIEYMANAIHRMREISAGGLRESGRRQILYFLDQCDQEAPLVRRLELIAGSAIAGADQGPGAYRRLKQGLYRWYGGVARARWFRPAITVFFIIQFLASLAVMLAVLFDPGEILVQLRGFAFDDWAILGSDALTAAFVGWGVLLLKSNRLRAFTMFQRSVLVSIFVGQLFLFYQNEFGALWGLLFDLLLYLGLRFVIERERENMLARAAV